MRDIDFETPTLESVPIINEFQKVFPNYLSSIPPKWEIDFDIDLFPDMRSVPPYYMSQAKIRDSNEQLNDFLNKGFI